jgi:hypothetical protein
MPDPARLSPDFGDSPPKSAPENPIPPDRELPTEPAISSPLGEIAEQAGAATRQRLSPPIEIVRERVEGFKDQARATLRDLPERLNEMKRRFKIIQGRTAERARVAASDFRQTAQSGARQAKGRFEFCSREYPLETLLSIAAAAFLVGFSIRMWRSRD